VLEYLSGEPMSNQKGYNYFTLIESLELYIDNLSHLNQNMKIDREVKLPSPVGRCPVYSGETVKDEIKLAKGRLKIAKDRRS